MLEGCDLMNRTINVSMLIQLSLLVFETFMTSSRTIFIGLPNRLKKLLTSKIGVASILIIIGFFSAFNGVSPDHLLLSMLGLGLPIVLLMFVLRRQDVHLTYELSDILPKRKGLIGIGMYLAGIYVFLTFFDRFEVITWSNQLIIWVCYLFAGSLLQVALKKNKNRTPLQPSSNPLSTLSVLYGGCIITISGVLFVFVFYTLGIRDVTVIITWILWNIIGITLVIYTVIQTLLKKKLD
jgi:hypothetical protein